MGATYRGPLERPPLLSLERTLLRPSVSTPSSLQASSYAATGAACWRVPPQSLKSDAYLHEDIHETRPTSPHCLKPHPDEAEDEAERVLR